MLRTNLVHGDAVGFAAIERAFVAANPGHSLAWLPGIEVLPAGNAPRVALVQQGEATARVARAGGAEVQRPVVVGDVIVLDAGEAATFSPPVSALVFGLPEAPAEEVPRVIRPDWDPRITDTPGGCATDAAAYRRVLLTWLGKNGPYTFHGLNVHRVRIDDSFTHYHPRVGGFDEFYLVQAVRDGARILTSSRTADIESETIAREDVATLFETTPLQPFDLVYLPRGTAHRGLGGVVAQVVTVPGFVPGAEIGIDHHLRAINERLGLAGAQALPLHAAGAAQPIVR
jgi:hypothetical protein